MKTNSILCVCSKLAVNPFLRSLYILSELPVEFLSPLGDYKVMETESVTLECEMSKPDKKAVWLKNGKVLEPSDRVVLRVDGTKHYLTITNSVLDDEAKYTIKVDEAESNGRLIVEGTVK